MQSKQYRVWDAEQHVYIDEIFLGPDGLLYAQNYDDMELLVPGSVSNEWQESHRAYEQQALDIREHQHEWYTVEFATGYPDKNGTMIFQGDLVQDMEDILSPGKKYFPVFWGKFICDNDSCETWVLGDFWEPGLYGSHRFLEVVSTIHTTPELLPKKEEEEQ